MNKILVIICLVLFSACTKFELSNDFVYVPIKSGKYEIATWQKITNSVSPIHLYIEGDGNAFDAYGRPTSNPTPHGDFVRRLADGDTNGNVVYMARPCQFIMSEHCDIVDWTNGRFSSDIIDSMSGAIKKIVGKKSVVLIGYSGGGMISGLVIKKFPDIKVKKWITIAGILNHREWTKYFNDCDLDKSENLERLPDVSQKHYIGTNDSVVPLKLAKTWVDSRNLVIVSGATHTDFDGLVLDFGD